MDEIPVQNAPIVIDCGTHTFKAGIAGDDRPRAIIPNVFGHTNPEIHKGDMFQHDSKSPFLVGCRAKWIGRIIHLKLTEPIHRVIFTNIDDCFTMWQHIFCCLEVNPQERPVLIAEPPLNSKKNREDMVKSLFETFGTPAICIIPQAVLSLFSSGRTTGVVVECGDGVTSIVPIYEGNALPHAISQHTLAGRDIREYIQRKIKNAHNTTAIRDEARRIKAETCYVPMESKETYVGHSTTDELKRCPDLLFKPTNFGFDEFGHYTGIHEWTYDAIQRCDSDLHAELFSNIDLAGGTTKLKGFQERMQLELSQLAPDHLHVEVIAQPGREHAAWIGGSVLGSCGFESLCASKSEYDACGVSIIDRQCF